MSRRLTVIVCLVLAAGGGAAAFVLRKVSRPWTSICATCPPLTTGEAKNASEFTDCIARGDVADCAPLHLFPITAVLSRINATVSRTDKPQSSQAVFEFAGATRRVPIPYLCENLDVFTDGISCAVVYGGPCGSSVDILKLTREGRTDYQVSEGHHAHATACYSKRRGLIYVWIFQPEADANGHPGGCQSWIRAYDWRTGKERFTIRMPPVQHAKMLISGDERYLWVSAPPYGVRRFDIDRLEPGRPAEAAGGAPR